MQLPTSLEKLIFEFSKFPGVGARTAMRFSLALSKKHGDVESLISALEDFSKLDHCIECGSLVGSEIAMCQICHSNSRSNQLMLIEDYSDLYSIESSGIYNGYYCIVGGLLSPMRGMMAESLEINRIVKRINTLLSKSDIILEVIFGLNSSTEGDITAEYIVNVLENNCDSNRIKLTKFALGIPRGADIDYLDQETLRMAFNSRN